MRLRRRSPLWSKLTVQTADAAAPAAEGAKVSGDGELASLRQWTNQHSAGRLDNRLAAWGFAPRSGGGDDGQGKEPPVLQEITEHETD